MSIAKLQATTIIFFEVLGLPFQKLVETLYILDSSSATALYEISD